MRGHVSPSNRTHSGNETHPISGKYEDENSREIPKRPVDQMLSQEPFEKAVEAFSQPLQKILRSTGNPIHTPRCDAGKNDQPESNHPAKDHRIGNREAEDAADLNGLLRQAMFLWFGNRRRR